MAVRSVKSQHIQRNLAFRRIDLLPDPQDRRAVGNAQKLGGMRIGGCGVDFFVGVRYFQPIVMFQDREERDPVQGRSREADEVLG